jgi:tetratricopeptide (TPR) repeat protein
MRSWILISLLMIAVTVGTLTATETDARELAQRGYTTFKTVLAGDEAKLPEAIRLMEDARKADETFVPNLFNLARAYFFDGITFDKEESISKAEKVFARIVELDPSRMDALSFHGAILAMMSRGNDMDMFMRGAKELRTAMQQAPNDLGVRIVTGFVSFNLPPEALPLIGNPDTLGNLKTIGGVLDSFSSDFAPHASVVMNSFIGESLMMSGDKEKARERFAQALKVPKPDDPGQRAGRELLDKTISARMNGSERPIFAESVFGGCHSCHLAAPEKLLKN